MEKSFRIKILKNGNCAELQGFHKSAIPDTRTKKGDVNAIPLSGSRQLCTKYNTIFSNEMEGFNITAVMGKFIIV
jgi:hypothetical protein